MLIAQCNVLCRPNHISIKSKGREVSSVAKKDSLEYVESSWKGCEISRFSCSATQHFIPRPIMVADIFEEFESPFKTFLATSLNVYLFMLFIFNYFSVALKQ